jgi:transcriptional regulator with XRE-family HTH domain
LPFVTGRAGQAVSGQARELGNELRRIRERAGLTLREVARVLHSDKSKVSRIENGLRLPSELDVAMYVALCHATEDERDSVTHPRQAERGRELAATARRSAA